VWSADTLLLSPQLALILLHMVQSIPPQTQTSPQSTPATTSLDLDQIIEIAAYRTATSSNKPWNPNPGGSFCVWALHWGELESRTNTGARPCILGLFERGDLFDCDAYGGGCGVALVQSSFWTWRR
jgi:hypothetical protein